MAGVEAFTILAVLDAKDRISNVIKRVDDTLDKFSSTSERAAEAARTAGSAIDESLLQTASGADELEVANARLAASQAKVALATQEQAAAERELLAAQAQAEASAAGDAAAMARQAEAATNLARAQKLVRNASAEAATAERIQTAANERAAGSADTAAASNARLGESAEKGSGKLRAIGKSAVIAGIAAGTIVYASVKAATSFQTITTRLVTSAGESYSKLKMVQQGILDVSNASGTSANKLGETMYYIEAAGYHAADGLVVLKAASQGAAAEGADTTTVAKALTDVLVDYHLKAGQAAKVTSQMVAAVSHGKTNLQDFSGAFANIIPAASAAGISFNDVGAALSEMTNHGFTAQRAGMNLAQALRSMLNPTSTMKSAINDLGGSTKELKDKLDGPNGLTDGMQYLSTLALKAGKEGTPAFASALKRLMGTAAGANVALATTGKNMDATKGTMDAMSKAAKDGSGNVKGFAEIQHTMGFKVNQAKAAIHNAGIEIGTAFLPAITKVAGAIAKILIPITHWVEKHQKLTAIILGSLIGLGLLAIAIAAVGAAIDVLFSPVTLVVIAVAALVAGIVYAYNHFKTFHDVVDKIGTFLKTVFVGAWHAAADVVNWFSKNVMPLIKEAIQDVIAWFAAHKQDFVDAWNDVVHGVQGAIQWFKTNVLDWLKARLDELVTWWNSHSSEIKEVWRALWAYLKLELFIFWNVILKPTLALIKGLWITVWNALKDAIKLVWGIISSVVTGAMHTVLNVIAVLLDVITGHWSKAWADLKKLVKQSFSDMINIIKRTASGFGTLLWDAGKNIIKGLIGGIKSMTGGIGHAISGIAQEVKDHFPWSPAKKGPLSGGGSPAIGGRNIVKMMAQGISSGTGDVVTAMTQVTQAASRRLTAGGLSLAGAGALGLTYAGSRGAGVGGTTGTVINIDMRDSQVIGNNAMDQLAQKIGNRIATRTLPAGGVRIRM